MEWNDLRDEVGTNVGVYDNPADLTEHSWTVMRFSEYENTQGDLEWLIRKDGCMHCEDPGCLKACPSPGAIIQYNNGIVDFHEENCIGCGYCITGCPFNVPRISKKDNKAYKCTLCSDRVAVRAGLREVLSHRRHRVRHQEDMKQHAAERIEDLKSRGFEQAGLYDPQGVGGTTSCTCCTTPTSRGCTTGCRRIRRSALWCRCGRASPSRWAWRPWR